MEAGLMRRAVLVSLTSALMALVSGFAQADGRCDLNAVVGYTLQFGKPIDGYVQGGMRRKGYEGCEPDRVLVFADNTGVKCKQMVRQQVNELPMAYLFARSASEMKLCVEGELFDVTQTN